VELADVPEPVYAAAPQTPVQAAPPAAEDGVMPAPLPNGVNAEAVANVGDVEMSHADASPAPPLLEPPVVAGVDVIMEELRTAHR
jgi:hypothetical protein